MPVIASLPDLLAALKSSVADGTFVRLALGKPSSELFPTKVSVTPTTVKGEARLQVVERFPTRDATRHGAPGEVLASVAGWLGKRFLSATVFTTGADLSVDHNRRGEPRFMSGRPSFKAAKTADESAAGAPGLDPSEPWLRAVGLTTPEGRVAAGKERKFRQVEKFLETFDALLRASGLGNGAGAGPLENATESGKNAALSGPDREGSALPGSRIRIVDMGSGLGYVTFALYAHLEKTLPGAASVLGVEARPDLVKSCNVAARASGFSRLRFIEGRIGETDPGAFDVLVALHACDTATDDALFSAVRAGAKIILSVPCCHKQLRPQIACADAWGEALRYGILAERQAEMVTDAVRAKLLEAHGYRTNVSEFVASEHTAKNVLISAVYKGPNPRKADVLKQVAGMMEKFGIKDQKLEASLRG